MPTQVSDLLSDLKERVDNLRETGVIPESASQKMFSPERLKDVLTEALRIYVLNIPVSSEIQEYIREASLGPNPVYEEFKVAGYRFPATLFTDRPDIGILSITVNGSRRKPDMMTSQADLVSVANSSYYRGSHAHRVDIEESLVYVIQGNKVSMRYIQRPETITTQNTILLRDSYRYKIVDIAIARLISTHQVPQPEPQEARDDQ